MNVRLLIWNDPLSTLFSVPHAILGIVALREGRGSGRNRALRRRVTLIFADYPGCPVQSRMTVLRRERALSYNASPEKSSLLSQRFAARSPVRA